MFVHVLWNSYYKNGSCISQAHIVCCTHKVAVGQSGTIHVQLVSRIFHECETCKYNLIGFKFVVSESCTLKNANKIDVTALMFKSIQIQYLA